MLSLVFISPPFNQHGLAAHRSERYVAVDRDKQWVTGLYSVFRDSLMLVC